MLFRNTIFTIPHIKIRGGHSVANGMLDSDPWIVQDLKQHIVAEGASIQHIQHAAKVFQNKVLRLFRLIEMALKFRCRFIRIKTVISDGDDMVLSAKSLIHW